MNIHSIIIADTGDALQIGVVLEERITRTKSTEVTSYLCAFYPQPLQGRPVEPRQALVPSTNLHAIDSGYSYGVAAFILKTPAYDWACSHVAALNPPPAPPAVPEPAPTPAATPAQDAATPAV